MLISLFLKFLKVKRVRMGNVPCCSFTCNYVLCINDFWCVYSEVVDKAGVDPLITLLNDAKPLVQANAAVCLTNLATEGILVTLPQTNKPWHGFRAFCPALGIWWFFFARLAFSRAWWYLYFTFPAFGTGCMFSRAECTSLFNRDMHSARENSGLPRCLRLFWLVGCKFL